MIRRPSAIALLAAASSIIPASASAQSTNPPAPAAKAPPPRAIVVTGTRRQYDSTIDRRIYSIGNDVQAANGSIGDVLRNIPSVDVDLQGNVSLRGDSHVTIMVDGKPTSLFNGPGGGQTLLQVPASQYERVEVMTNPSAAFGANGSGGIINLITRKNRASGVTGSVRGALGTRGRRKLGASIADKVGKLTLNADASWRGDPQFTTDIVNFFEPDSGVTSREVTKGVGEVHLWTARVGADADLGGFNSLSADIHRTDFLFHSDMKSTLIGTDASDAIVREFDRNGFFLQNRFDTEGSLSFNHDTSGKADDYSASLTYESTRNDDVDRFDNISPLPPAPDLFDNVSRISQLHRTEAKADYTSPRPDGSSIQAGFDVQLDRDRFHDLGGFGATAAIAAVPQPQFTELFAFDRSVGAAYAIYQRDFGKLETETGIRLEAEDRRSGVIGDGSSRDRQARFFPSLHLQWKLDKTLSLKGSVSTRIQRPDPEDFDPFRRFVDPFHFDEGNPRLKSETTLSFEGGIERKKGKSFGAATLFYRRNRDGVTDLSQDLGDGVLLTTRENLVGSSELGFELVANGPLTKTLGYRLSGDVYRFSIDATNLGFGRRSALIESGKAGIDWQPGKKDLAQLNVSLSGETLYPQGEADPMLLINLGYRHQLTRQLFAFLTAQDALHTYTAHGRIRTPTLIQRTFDSAKTQAAFIGVTWNFGGKGKQPGFDYAG
ncbi:MAG TPA: outer membrane beta-barrel family protein [Sphingomicrobium sp.]|nr:outer membrane beta-barrel family protein [Sphingomicrobium sp.]